jgi:hypothetical protein
MSLNITAMQAIPVFFNAYEPKPNTFQIINNLSGTLYVSQNSGVTKNNFEYSIPANATHVISYPTVIVNQLYFYAEVTGRININAMYSDDMYPSDLFKTSSTIVQYEITGAVTVSSIEAPMPSGTNKIGSVDVASLPETIEMKCNAIKVILTAGVSATVKAGAGYVVAVNSSLTDLLISDGSTEVWKGNYNAGSPFYCTTSIKLLSAAGGTVYIVIK